MLIHLQLDPQTLLWLIIRSKLMPLLKVTFHLRSSLLKTKITLISNQLAVIILMVNLNTTFLLTQKLMLLQESSLLLDIICKSHMFTTLCSIEIVKCLIQWISKSLAWEWFMISLLLRITSLSQIFHWSSSQIRPWEKVDLFSNLIQNKMLNMQLCTRIILLKIRSNGSLFQIITVSIMWMPGKRRMIKDKTSLWCMDAHKRQLIFHLQKTILSLKMKTSELS